MAKEDSIQKGLQNYFGRPEEKRGAAHDTQAPEQNVPSSMTKEETFSNHNLTISDTLFKKLKFIQIAEGKNLRTLTDELLREYVTAYEQRNGEIKI